MKISQIVSGLKKNTKCEIITNKEILNFYSVDASYYRIQPKIVVIPNNEKDIIKIIRFAYRKKISITPRGAGTGLVGGALNGGIILDLKNLNAIKIKKNYVTVEAGTKKGELDKRLKKMGKFFPPNPSVGNFCSVGGMIGTNASGSRSLKYGSVIDNILEIKFVDGKGHLCKLPEKNNFSKKIEKMSKKIEKNKIPKVTKNSCGYRIDKIKNSFDTHKILAGSEGTLGIITSVKLKIKTIPKKQNLTIISYEDYIDAVSDVPKLLKLKPSALEFIDKKTLDNIDFKFSKNTKCLLFVEFDEKLTKNQKKISKNNNGQIIFSSEKKREIEKWWSYRDASLSFSLRNIAKNERMPHIIEDATVPIQQLDKVFRLTSNICKKYHAQSITYGHIGNGNLHVRLAIKNNSQKIMQKIGTDFFTKVIQLGGTITGEHGDGLARSEFVKKQYGEKNYLLFKALKQLFDPKMILNPDKIITSKKLMVEKIFLE